MLDIELYLGSSAIRQWTKINFCSKPMVISERRRVLKRWRKMCLTNQFILVVHQREAELQKFIICLKRLSCILSFFFPFKFVIGCSFNFVHFPYVYVFWFLCVGLLGRGGGAGLMRKWRHCKIWFQILIRYTNTYATNFGLYKVWLVPIY